MTDSSQSNGKFPWLAWGHYAIMAMPYYEPREALVRPRDVWPQARRRAIVPARDREYMRATWRA